nr:translation initiation factor IF-2-like [Aegilops tauschii subsp. strangulata]
MCQTRAAATKAVAAKKAVKAVVAKRTATASSSSKRRWTLSSSPSPSDSTLEAEFDLGDTETLAQRAAKRAKPSAGEERQQEEPPRATPNTPPPSTTPPRGASPARASTTKRTHMEEEEASLGAGGSAPTTNAGGEGATSSQPGVDPSSMDQDDIDIVIEEVARDAEAEATKVAAEEAANSATEEAAKRPAGETSETAAGEAGKGPAGESGKAATKEAAKEPAEEEAANDQSSSPAAPALDKYLKVGDDLFIRLPGTAGGRAPAEGEVFDDETLATAGLQVVNEPSVGGDGSQGEQLLRAMSANFQKLQALHRASLDKAKSKMAAVDKVEADFEVRVTQAQAWFREAQEEQKVAQGELAERKCELILKQADIEKAQELKLDGLEGTLSEVRSREETLTKDLEEEKRQRRDGATEYEEYAKGMNLWIGCLVDVAGKLTAQLAVMGVPDIKLSEDRNISPNARLTLFFERILDALDQLRSNRATYLANEARWLCRGALTKVAL